MKVLTEYLKFHTKTHRAYVHITPQVEEITRKSGVKEGMVLVSAMHITAGVYVNDNESGLIEDIDQMLQPLVDVLNEPALIVVDVNAGGDVHGRHQHHAFLHAAFSGDLFHLRRDM